MILENKGVLDNTMLKIVSKVLKKNPSAVKGFKVKTLNGVATITYDDIIKFVETLSDEIAKGNYDELRKCETCGNFSYPGKKGAPGWCSPKDFTSSRKVDDHWSRWIPMTKEQQYTRKKVKEFHGFGSLQTKRTGDGSEDSKEGH